MTDASGYTIAAGAVIFAALGLLAELIWPGLRRSGSHRFLFYVLALPASMALGHAYGGPLLEDLWPPAPRPGYEGTLQRLQKHLDANPAWRERMRGARNREEAQRQAVALATRGLRRLDDDALTALATVQQRMLAGVDTSICGALARGLATPDQAEASIRALDEPTREAWAEVAFQAVTAELRGGPPPSFDDRGVSDALEVLIGALPLEERARMKQALGFPLMANDADLCWATRTVYANVAGQPEGMRRVLLRAMVPR
jgi:hypothetical protein